MLFFHKYTYYLGDLRKPYNKTVDFSELVSNLRGYSIQSLNFFSSLIA